MDPFHRSVFVLIPTPFDPTQNTINPKPDINMQVAECVRLLAPAKIYDMECPVTLEKCDSVLISCGHGINAEDIRKLTGPVLSALKICPVCRGAIAIVISYKDFEQIYKLI